MPKPRPLRRFGHLHRPPPESASCPTPTAGNPITIGAGIKVQQETDITGAGDLILVRYHHGLGFYTPFSTPSPQIPSLGHAWRHNFDKRLHPLTGMDALAALTYPNGDIQYFDANGRERFNYGRPGSQLIVLGNGYQIHTGETTEHYDATGRLISLTRRDGRTLTLTYSSAATPATVAPTPGLLIQVTDTFGRSLNFVYDGSGRITQASGPDGKAVTYAYDGPSSLLASGQAPANNLTTVTYPDGTSRTYGYNEPGHTGDRSPHTLTGITDENGTRYVTYTYDGEGRAIDEIFPAAGSNTNRYQLAFGSNSTTVTDPLGTQRVYAFQTLLGVTRHTGVSQPGGSGCGPASSALTYDSNGNVVSRTDFNGNKTTYTYDPARNLETQRVEASGQPEARTITTQWHPDWRQPLKVAEPRKRTTWTINGDGGIYCAPQTATVPGLDGSPRPIGVICTRTEQATTDLTGSQGLNATATGAPRTWTTTYNQYGQILTVNGPRTDVADVTTYTYYPATDPDLGKRGNIATVTNALGHVTTISAYDPNGNPLTIIDPNGIVTTLTYDLRQRLTSRRIGTETTAYQYDPAGQLTQVTLPDGCATVYTYDGAHRLTAISDRLGNRITYTLDPMGNRIQEDIHDPQGQLTRTLSRAYDALGRLQTLTGIAP